MHDLRGAIRWCRDCTAIVWSLVLTCTHIAAAEILLTPANMPRIGSVDERFQSYNIEAVEVTGGRFWKPYASVDASHAGAQPAAGTPPGMDPSLYEYRAPIDLSNPRLRKLAAALGPAYMRVSGTWMNSTYFQDSDDPAPAHPPAARRVAVR